MWNCCCEYTDPGIEDDCCPDWCESRRVKGRFGLAFVAETPCCCPEPIGWQVEFCDTPSKVEQRCREMVQWANCPPLPRCEPCPPVEVCSPCYPPKCNPCCPISNPCPPRCPPRCCRPCECCPRPPSPSRKRCCPKIECPCCPPKTKQKCGCSSKSAKPKCRCEEDDDDDEDDENDPCCPCSGKKGDDGRRRKRKDRDGDRGDRERNESFYDDEIPVKESKPKPKESEIRPTPSVPPYARPSNQMGATPPRTGRNSSLHSNLNTQNLYVQSQEGSSRGDSSCAIPILELNWQKNAHESSKHIDSPSNNENNIPTSDVNEEQVMSLVNYSKSNSANTIKEGSQINTDLPDGTPVIVQYANYQSRLNMNPQYNPRIQGIKEVDDSVIAANMECKASSEFYPVKDKSSTSSSDRASRRRRRRRRSSSRSTNMKAIVNEDVLPQDNCCSSEKSVKDSKCSKELDRFTSVYSNTEDILTEECILVKKRKWLPFELIKSLSKRVYGLFKSSGVNNDDDVDCPHDAYDGTCNV